MYVCIRTCVRMHVGYVQNERMNMNGGMNVYMYSNMHAYVCMQAMCRGERMNMNVGKNACMYSNMRTVVCM